jgi:hypothetical protein
VNNRVHPAYVVALVASSLAAAAMPFVGRVLDAREDRGRQRMNTLALSMKTPRGFVADTTCALRGPGAVRCGHAPGAPREVAEQSRQDLAATTGATVSVSCDRYPNTPRPMVPVRVECRVRFVDGDHDVLVTVVTRPATGARAVPAEASDYLVQIS